MSAVRRDGLPAVQLDHVGCVTRELMPLMTVFDRLGFKLTEPRRLMRRNVVSGELESLEQSSCHAVFQHGYIELSAVHSQDRAHHLAPYLTSGTALKIVALGTADVLELHVAAARAGLRPSDPSLASRAIDYGARHGEARFRWFMLSPDVAAEGLVCVVRHLTPELVFQHEVQRHPNGTVALTGVTLCIEDLDQAASRYESLLGIEPARPASSERIRRFALGSQWLELASPSALRDRYSGARLPPAPCFAGVTVRVRSLAQTVALLGGNDVAFQRRGGDGVWTCAEAAGNTIVEFVASD